MADTFKTALLLSMPQLQDPNFAKTVVLLCEYNPDGAFGLVLNRPTNVAASEMVRLDPPIVAGNDMPLWIGGPVDPQRGWILLGDEPPAEFAHPRRSLSVDVTDAAARVLEAGPAPRARVLAGYAGWGAGQLDEELAQSAWLLGEVDLHLVFDVAPVDMWDTAGLRLGADPAALTTSHGVH